MTPAPPATTPAPAPPAARRNVLASLPAVVVVTVLALLVPTFPAHADLWPGDLVPTPAVAGPERFGVAAAPVTGVPSPATGRRPAAGWSARRECAARAR